jgi:hypothetical protein
MFDWLKVLYSKLKPSPVLRYAGAYLFSVRMVTVSFGRVPAGFFVQCDPFIELPLESDDEKIGQAVLKSLKDFRAHLAAPDDFAAHRKKQILALGFGSERQMQRQALYCSVTLGPEGFKFEPTHNGGASGDSKGFQPNGSALTLPLSSSAAAIGAALRRSFSLCTTSLQPPVSTHATH